MYSSRRYHFTCKPDANLFCAVCLELACQPKQCEDCGKLFCSECIEKNGRRPCPHCRTIYPNYFKDIRSRRDIDELQVSCTNTKKGCQWTGTIGTLDNHIASCQFALVPCPNKCKENKGAGMLLLVRKDLNKHLKIQCPKRAYECFYCGEKGTFANITEGHEKICEKKTIACPNKRRGCSQNTEKGCQWTGTIGTLDDHIASCQFALVPCPNKCREDKGAGELLLIKKDLDRHLNMKCPKRAYDCFYCGEEGTFASITEDHEKLCKKKIIACPNKRSGCSLSMKQEKIKEHVSSNCKFAEVACVYESLGCGVRMLRKDIVEHQENDDKVHLHLMLKSLSLLKEQHEVLLEQHETLLEQHETLSDEVVIFQLTGYANKKEKNEIFYSKSFYTHPGGYEMSSIICANGHGAGKGTHVSVFTELLDGCYDNQLHWPFLGTVTVELLNQLGDYNHHRLVIEHDAGENMRVGTSKGYSKFLPHSALSHNPATNTQYLLDDTLYFRVSVKVDNHKPWLVCTQHS